MPLRNQHLTHGDNTQTIWCLDKDWQHAGGARAFQSATVFPGILPSCAIFRKSHCNNLIFVAVNTLAFWPPRSGPPPVALLELKQNSTLIYFRNEIPHCPTAFRAIRGCFNFYFTGWYGGWYGEKIKHKKERNCKNLNEPSTQLSEFQILFAPSTNRSHKAQNQVS